MRIIYFDGLCNLCNGFVDFMIRHDHLQKFKFAPLQGATASQRLPEAFKKNLDTVILEEDGEYFTESSAALRAVSGLGGIYGVAALFLFIPRSWRDLFYRWIARRRYRFFGQRETCRLPQASERVRFLD